MRAQARPAWAVHPKIHAAGVATTVWVRRALAERSRSPRLTRRFARQLTRTAGRARVDWPLLLAVVRAEGRTEAGPRALARLSGRLARLGPRDDPRGTVLRLSGKPRFADRVIALARYHRAVGLGALTRGLDRARPTLTARLLADPRIDFTPAGRADVASGRMDVRVLAVIAYLAEAHGQVSVSSLVAGHRTYARPGVFSAHVYGRAVDISSLGGVPISGNQAPGDIAEEAVRNLLLLPAEVRPSEVISLLELGGPSFREADHADHIHIGY